MPRGRTGAVVTVTESDAAMTSAAWMTLLPALVLVLTRISGLMLTAPIFSSAAIPPQVKIGLTVILSLTIFPMVYPQMTDVPPSLLGISVGLATELMIGLAIGLAASLFFAGLELGGELISQQMGLGLAQVFNPMLESESGVVSQVYLMVGSALFLVFNGHHMLLAAVLDSYRYLPPMATSLDPHVLTVLRALLSSSFVIAMKLAVPVVLLLFLVTAFMGFLGRTVPQINILVVGFPLRIGVGLVGMVATFGLTLLVFTESYGNLVNQVADMIRHLG